jgi:hypothetical protein
LAILPALAGCHLEQRLRAREDTSTVEAVLAVISAELFARRMRGAAG